MNALSVTFVFATSDCKAGMSWRLKRFQRTKSERFSRLDCAAQRVRLPPVCTVCSERLVRDPRTSQERTVGQAAVLRLAQTQPAGQSPECAASALHGGPRGAPLPGTAVRLCPLYGCRQRAPQALSAGCRNLSRCGLACGQKSWRFTVSFRAALCGCTETSIVRAARVTLPARFAQVCALDCVRWMFIVSCACSINGRK